ncbi:MAG: alpha/beta hydrolase [Rikenellaceae bacterium]|nr:alpha/beta hydrolase [Rikenellaceae bacterium]
MKRILLTLLAVMALSPLGAATPQTETYAIKGDDTLRMDFYAAPHKDSPCLIFMFGGGFVRGTRNAEQYLDFFEDMASRGYAVATIDYRLGLSPLLTATSKPSVGELVDMLTESVQMAVDDLYSATSHIVQNAERLGVDPSKIIISGSSAGAIAVLTGEWQRATGQATEALPEGFRYAGVVSMAGAIYTTDGRPSAVDGMCPLLLFHGDADSNVPYRKLAVGKVGMYGADYIYDKMLKKSGKPYYVCIYPDVDHVVAGAPYMQNREQIEWFINQIALGGRVFEVYEQIADPAYPVKRGPRTIFDYIRANFGPQQ